MTYLWLSLAFVAGAVFWHKIGLSLVRRAFGHQALTRDIFKSMSDEGIKRVQRQSAEEIERRRKVLA